MEKGDVEPGEEERLEEKVSDEEEEILRYEENITELLLTVTNLHSKIEHLQQQKAREDEDFSDLGSEYTASLPRRTQPFPNLAMSPPPLVHLEEGKADLFLDVHKAMTSLENTVLSYRNRIPSVEAELEGYTQAAERLEQSLRKFQGGEKELPPPLSGEAEACVEGLPPDQMGLPPPWNRREIALYKQRNAALRAALEEKEAALGRSKTTLCTYQEERDKLQRKVKELQEALWKTENLVGGFASHVQEGETGGFQDPAAAAQNLILCFQGAPSTHPVCCIFPQQGPLPVETRTKNMEVQTQQLHGFVEKLKRLNQLLSTTLQECKSDSECLSMLLGRRESDTTALRLAVQYSERCLEAYEMLWSLTLAQQRPWKESPKKGDVPSTALGDLDSTCHEMKLAVMDEALRSWKRSNVNNEGSRCSSFKQSSPEPSGLEERKQMLQEFIRRLRVEQASLKLPPAQRTPPGADSVAARINAGIGVKVAEVQRGLCGVFPTEATNPKMGKLHLVQELQTTREALADLNIKLYLTEKEKQGLELQTYTLKAQDAACLMTIRILQEDSKKSQGQTSGSSDGSNSSSSSDEDSNLRDYIPICVSKGTHFRSAQDAIGRQPVTDPAAELLDTLTRNRELNHRAQSLLGELEEKLEDCKAQEMQSVELTRNFFKAHSALVFAYRNARRKQEAQVCQLETQIRLMSHQQAGQVRSLRHTLQRLEGRAGRRSPHAGQTPSPAREDDGTGTNVAAETRLDVK